MATNETEIAVLREVLRQQAADIAALKAEDNMLDRKITALEEMAGEWKGGFLALAALGGIAGWIASFWDKVTKPWH